MGYINAFIGIDCSLKVKDGQLIIKEGESVPIEDVNCVMIDNLRTTVSVYALNALIEAGATVIFCDGKHLPSCAVLPHSGYYRRLSALQAQANISKPLQKQLWQSIIKQKIFNQAKVLNFCGKQEKAEKLFELSKSVASGDPDNKEAEAARIYFPALFGEGFTRGEDININAALNYGYAIVRSLAARQLSARGLECAYGLFHKNQLNAFNLADDIMEPFRPMVDSLVFSMATNKECSIEDKRKLFAVVDTDVYIENGNYTLSASIERMAESLLQCFLNSKNELVLPVYSGMTRHSYE